MKKSELKQLIKEEIFKNLKEDNYGTPSEQLRKELYNIIKKYFTQLSSEEILAVLSDLIDIYSKD